MVSGARYAIRPFVAGDERAINDGFNRAFRRDRALAEWAWKFPPEPGGRLIMVAEQSGELLAHYSAVPLRFQVDGREWPTGQVVDVFAVRSVGTGISPRSAFVATGEAFYEEFGAKGRVPLFYGFPGPRHRRQGLAVLSYDEMPVQSVCYLSRRPPHPPARARRRLYRAERARDWEPRLDELWERVREDYPVAAVRDSEWALRRLAGHPAVRYHRFLLLPRLGGRPVGWVAFRTDGGRCRWVDLLWDRHHPGALDLVDHLSARLAAQTGAALEELWLNGDDEGAARLQQRGFVAGPDPHDLAMTSRKFTNDVDYSAFNGRVYITMADCDLV